MKIKNQDVWKIIDVKIYSAVSYRGNAYLKVTCIYEDQEGIDHKISAPVHVPLGMELRELGIGNTYKVVTRKVRLNEQLNPISETDIEFKLVNKLESSLNFESGMDADIDCVVKAYRDGALPIGLTKQILLGLIQNSDALIQEVKKSIDRLVQ